MRRWLKACLKGIALLLAVIAIYVSSVWLHWAVDRLIAFTDMSYQVKTTGEKTVFENLGGL